MALQADVEEVMDLTEQVYKAAEQQTYDKQLQPIVDKCAEEMKTWADKYKVALPAEKTADAFISFAQRYEEASRGWLYAEVTEEDLQPRQKLSEETAAQIRKFIGEETQQAEAQKTQETQTEEEGVEELLTENKDGQIILPTAETKTETQAEETGAEIAETAQQTETTEATTEAAAETQEAEKEVKTGISLTAKLIELSDEDTEAAARAIASMDVVSKFDPVLWEIAEEYGTRNVNAAIAQLEKEGILTPGSKRGTWLNAERAENLAQQNVENELLEKQAKKEDKNGRLYNRGTEERTAAEPAGVNGRAAERAIGKSGAERSRDVLRYREIAKNRERQSTKSLGIQAGTERLSVTVIENDKIPKALLAQAAETEDLTGAKVVFITGNLETYKRNGRGVTSARGLTHTAADGSTTIYVQLDNTRYTPEQLLKHETYHAMARRNPSLLDDTLAWLEANNDGKTVKKMLDDYMLRELGYTVDTTGMTEEEAEEANRKLLDARFEEMLADAWAGMNTLGETETGRTVRSELMEERRTSKESTGKIDIERYSAEEIWTEEEIQAYNGLATAVEMAEKGATPNEIYNATEWMQNNAGAWGYAFGSKLDQSAVEKLLERYEEEYGRLGNLDIRNKRNAENSEEKQRGTGTNRGRNNRFGNGSQETTRRVPKKPWKEIGKRKQERITKRIIDAIDFQNGTEAYYLEKSGTGKSEIVETMYTLYQNDMRLFENYGRIFENIDEIKAILDEETAKDNEEDTRYSAEYDSEGEQLTEAQAEFFKDSKVRDEEGKLLVVYHGTDAEFTVFDRTKGRSFADIQGMFFSPWEIDAGGYGSVKAYYLNIKNPASESMGYRALQRFQSENERGVKAREYLEGLGYDGVNNGNEEFIAFYPNQIKAIENENPTESEDIRYSVDEETDAEYMALAEDPEANAERLQEMVDEAAEDWGAYSDEDGIPVVVYHGTGKAIFTKFNTPYIFLSDSLTTSGAYAGKTDEILQPRNDSLYNLNKESIKKIIDWLSENRNVDYKKADFYLFRDTLADHMNSAYGEIAGYGNTDQVEITGDETRDNLIKLANAYKQKIEKIKSGDFTETDLQEMASLLNVTREFFDGIDSIKKRFELQRYAHNELKFRFNGEYEEKITDFADGKAMFVSQYGSILDESGLRDFAKEQSRYYMMITGRMRAGNYAAYVKMDNPFITDAEGQGFRGFGVQLPGGEEETFSTDSLAQWARENGYDGVIVKNVYDTGRDDVYETATDYIVFDSEQVKSADPVTYDDDGNVIPLSQRFNAESEDIRYSADQEEYTETDLTEKPQKGTLKADEDIEETNIKSGTAAIDEMIEAASLSDDPSSIMLKDVMYRSDIGYIDFKWGVPGRGKKFKKGYGISHIITKRNAENLNGKAVAHKLVEVIAKATDYDLQKSKKAGDELGRLRLYYNDYTAVLVRTEERKNWLLTGWKNEKEVNEYATGAGYDASSATASKTTQTRLAGVDSFTSKENVPQYEDVVNKRGENREIKFSSDDIEDYTDEEWARDNEIGTVTDEDDGRGSRRGQPEAAGRTIRGDAGGRLGRHEYAGKDGDRANRPKRADGGAQNQQGINGKN